MRGHASLALALAVSLTAGGGRALSAQSKSTDGPIAEATIRAHMSFLASDAMKGRGSGTEDEWRAATYIGAQLMRLGIEPLGDDGGFVQRVATGRSAVSAPPTLTIKDLKLTHGREMLVQSLGPTMSGPLARYVAGSPVPAGAFVLVPDGVTPDAAAIGRAAAVLTPETTTLRSTWDTTGASRMPTIGVGRAGGAPPPARIVLTYDAYGRLAAQPDGTPVTVAAETKPGFTWNVIGQIKGRDTKRSSEIILLTAHLDHLGVRGTGADTIFNGADDDASGSTAVLALAEALASGERPKRTVMFAWFGSEESGGFGARNFLDHPPVPLDRIVANLEFEMIGRPDEKVRPHTLWLTGYERSNLGPELARRGARIVADPHPDQQFFQRSDNIQLACQGIIAQTVSSFGLHKEYHQANDDIAHIDFAHMTDAIRSMLKPVQWLGDATFKPEWNSGKKPGPGNGCR